MDTTTLNRMSISVCHGSNVYLIYKIFNKTLHKKTTIEHCGYSSLREVQTVPAIYNVYFTSYPLPFSSRNNLFIHWQKQVFSEQSSNSEWKMLWNMKARQSTRHHFTSAAILFPDIFDTSNQGHFACLVTCMCQYRKLSMIAWIVSIEDHRWSLMIGRWLSKIKR